MRPARTTGERIALLRQGCKMTQSDLAAKLDPPVLQSSVSRWEDGKSIPKDIYKAQLLGIFNIDQTYLFPIVAVGQ